MLITFSAGQWAKNNSAELRTIDHFGISKQKLEIIPRLCRRWSCTIGWDKTIVLRHCRYDTWGGHGRKHTRDSGGDPGFNPCDLSTSTQEINILLKTSDLHQHPSEVGSYSTKKKKITHLESNPYSIPKVDLLEDQSGYHHLPGKGRRHKFKSKLPFVDQE